MNTTRAAADMKIGNKFTVSYESGNWPYTETITHTETIKNIHHGFGRISFNNGAYRFFPDSKIVLA